MVESCRGVPPRAPHVAERAEIMGVEIVGCPRRDTPTIRLMQFSSNRGLMLAIVPGLVLAAVVVLFAQGREDQSRQMRPRRVDATADRTTEVRAGGKLQAVINAARCGDVIVLQAGATWDGTHILPNKNCTQSTPITIRSSGVASLPAGRVGVSDAQHMPKIRAMANESAFRAAEGAGWWILDGLEITDNAGRGVVNALVDLGISATGVHDITVQRCYFHQKETGSNYNRSAMRAVWFEGRNLTFKWNYVYLVGYYYPEAVGADYYQLDTTAVLSVGGPGPILMEDNYVSVWWNGFFLGGTDTAPQNLARLTNASLTSATFSNTTGITPGIVLRFNLEATGTLSAGSTRLTKTGGASITSAEIGRTIGLTNGGTTHLMRVIGVTGNEIAVAPQGAIAPDGNYPFAVYETAQVTSVSGSTVNYSASSPVDVDALKQVPQSAAWNYGDQGLISDVSVVRNTFDVDPGFAHDIFQRKGYSPKGAFEIKNVNRFLYEGNRNVGYGACWAITPRNQYGTAPWITASNLVLRNNWFVPTEKLAESSGRMAVISLQDELHTTTPARDIQIYNNFAKNVVNMLQMKGGDGWSVRHNTIINDLSVANAYHVAVVLEGVPARRFEFRDNLVGYSNYGMSCAIPPNSLGTCWPYGTFRNNIVVDFARAGFDVGIWGGRGIHSLIPKSFAQIGFVDASKDDYRLATSSPYKGKASDGADPGVDMGALTAALSGAARPGVGER
jgi:hypothetical protein